MQPNILITGAAGYIGGSLITDFTTGQSIQIDKKYISAAVRSEEQAKVLAGLGINVIQVDLTVEASVEKGVLDHNIDVVIHTASSLNETLALNLIHALSKQKKATGRQTYFIHTSGLSAFYEKTGWPSGVKEDTGPIFETEKQLADSFPIRKTDVAVIEHAEAQGVTSYIVIPSVVHGKGSGQWNQLSVVLPIFIKGTIAQGRVSKFPENTKVSGVHITDMTALYGRILSNIISETSIPSGKNGFYFALAHDLVWWEVLDHLAQALKARGLVQDTNLEIWPNDKTVGEALGVPEAFVQAFWNAGETITITNPSKIGWKPTWDNARFLENIDDEVKAVLDLGEAKSSLVDSLWLAAKG